MYEMITPSAHYGGWFNQREIFAIFGSTVKGVQ